ncbi:MAG TPA: 16S rRNA (guanine(527)-N(7))-methyltransferase RsmG [Accumulibacter sp.]|nr:16S rRNA (guanine(527)-N(7))-methyltransferase RsmG [Accumulibacter sp.]HMW16772.1 16S rRNA (guanine(527)-N(7))-methyltransferase RsmG [Accumulibacter sp.]HMX23015.1 16S rRNA (guanine(527)-N(7))-methyltransferase RsmG [Accumulibacter sp.]HMY07149.1 16S rRNA (guanine(527)-N(7))-methyltransferase RsmG [Accumulibacter sp.]HNC17881.1 16S rRNA (guanine(527)-N(7))-methyltransferase RsmG [Accumulibacter sp.]
MTPSAQLAEGVRQLGLDLPATAQEKLLAYLALLDKWNRTYQLTSIRDTEQAVSGHLLDSLSLLPFITADRVLDVGSGGGLPGIPLAIADDRLQLVLLDSNSKKCAFLRQAAIELALSNVAVHCGRVENYQSAAGFPVIVARAFADLSALVRLTRHLLRDGGQWMAMKGRRPDEELAALSAEITVQAVHRLQVPGVLGERHLLIIAGSGKP